jgi:iron complex outermembrane receptor protein
MDSPLTRVNPLDLATVTLEKSSLPAVSGFAGSVHFRRRPPSDSLRLHASLAQSVDAVTGTDAAVMAEGRKHALSLRYVTGDPYLDGGGRDFTERYGYTTLQNLTLAEAAARGSSGDWRYGGGFSYTENVLFPYLLMDERFNRVWNGHLQWKQYRLYATYTDHLMTNEFRQGMMDMRTAARNLTMGVTGDHFEAWMRHWDADNRFDSRSVDSIATIHLGKIPVAGEPLLENHMLPDARQYYAAGSYRLQHGAWSTALRAGLTHLRIGDEAVLPMYREVFADVENGQWFAVAAGQIEWRRRAGLQGGYGLQLEAATEAPQMEELYIAVRKPGGKPAWIGNPTLSQPVRATLRANGSWKGLQAEAFFSGVSGYVQPAKRSGSSGMYQTFGNVDAWIAGATLRYERTLLTADIAWTWGEHMDGNTPLSEIPPLRGQLLLRTPSWRNLVLQAGIVAQANQPRVDPALAEFATPGWMRIDLGLHWTGKFLRIDILAENLFDHSYRQHLSYLRSPFAAGFQVWEPGRTVRLQVSAGI